MNLDWIIFVFIPLQSSDEIVNISFMETGPMKAKAPGTHENHHVTLLGATAFFHLLGLSKTSPA